MATYLRTVDRNHWIPDDAKPRKNARQRQFLLLSDVEEVFYGGAAGGGKTYATLIAAAQFVDVPGYSALLLRENFADLDRPQAWMQLAMQWWHKKASWNASARRWTFPSGATVSFGYLERDADAFQYDGGAYQFIAIDELTQHTEWRYRFMFGRMRRPAEGPLSQVPLRMRSTSNPGNKGHQWVKSRFIDSRTREPGAVFVPAKLDDNAGNLDVKKYRENQLAKLDPVTRRQREHGDWDAVAGGRFKAEWFKLRYTWRGTYLCLEGRPPIEFGRCVVFGTADFAASAKETADWTVISVWAVTPSMDLVWLDMARGHWELPEIVPEVRKLYDRWRLAYIAIEGGGTQKGGCSLVAREGYIVKEMNPSGTGGKLVRATPAIVHAESGKVWLPQGAPWLADAIAELVLFTGDEKKDAHDDIVDTIAYAALRLDKRADEKAGGQVPRVIGQR